MQADHIVLPFGDVHTVQLADVFFCLENTVDSAVFFEQPAFVGVHELGVRIAFLPVGFTAGKADDFPAHVLKRIHHPSAESVINIASFVLFYDKELFKRFTGKLTGLYLPCDEVAVGSVAQSELVDHFGTDATFVQECKTFGFGVELTGVQALGGSVGIDHSFAFQRVAPFLVGHGSFRYIDACFSGYRFYRLRKRNMFVFLNEFEHVAAGTAGKALVHFPDRRNNQAG